MRERGWGRERELRERRDLGRKKGLERGREVGERGRSSLPHHHICEIEVEGENVR